jgi:hypothetical protein
VWPPLARGGHFCARHGGRSPAARRSFSAANPALITILAASERSLATRPTRASTSLASVSVSRKWKATDAGLGARGRPGLSGFVMVPQLAIEWPGLTARFCKKGRFIIASTASGRGKPVLGVELGQTPAGTAKKGVGVKYRCPLRRPRGSRIAHPLRQGSLGRPAFCGGSAAGLR